MRDAPLSRILNTIRAYTLNRMVRMSPSCTT